MVNHTDTKTEVFKNNYNKYYKETTTKLKHPFQ